MRTLLILATIALTTLVDANEPKSLVLYHFGEIPVEMRRGDAYGVMLINDGWEEDPSPRYIRAIAKTRTVVDTKDIELSQTILRRISDHLLL